MKKIICLLILIVYTTILCGTFYYFNNKNLQKIASLSIKTNNLNQQLDDLNESINNLKQDNINALCEKNEEIKLLNEKLANTNLSLNQYKANISNIKKETKENSKRLKNELNNINNKVVTGKYKSIVKDDYAIERARGIEVSEDELPYKETVETIYEFKSNGDFYINDQKIGTYNSGNIFYKSEKDELTMTANYYIDKNILYIDIYESQTKKIMHCLTAVYKCEKI